MTLDQENYQIQFGVVLKGELALDLIAERAAEAETKTWKCPWPSLPNQ